MDLTCTNLEKERLLGMEQKLSGKLCVDLHTAVNSSAWLSSQDEMGLVLDRVVSQPRVQGALAILGEFPALAFLSFESKMSISHGSVIWQR